MSAAYPLVFTLFSADWKRENDNPLEIDISFTPIEKNYFDTRVFEETLTYREQYGMKFLVTLQCTF